MTSTFSRSAAALVWLLIAPAVLFAQFTESCAHPHYPAPAPAGSLDIDATCGAPGSGGAEAAQNRAKNNFCATGDPTPVTIAQLIQLQHRVDDNRAIPFGERSTAVRHAGPAIDREPLRALGEGTIRVLTGYVRIARQEGHESVNCGTHVPDEALDHDIHISVVRTVGADECTGVVAEMSPHHRPESWTAANVERVARAGRRVRVTGQLMFDSSHVPCDGGVAVHGNPARASLWEIHPIYSFDVCTARCDSPTPTWTPLDQWIAAGQ